jgi:hypothetical protein
LLAVELILMAQGLSARDKYIIFEPAPAADFDVFPQAV